MSLIRGDIANWEEINQKKTKPEDNRSFQSSDDGSMRRIKTNAFKKRNTLNVTERMANAIREKLRQRASFRSIISDEDMNHVPPTDQSNILNTSKAFSSFNNSAEHLSPNKDYEKVKLARKSAKLSNMIKEKREVKIAPLMNEDEEIDN